MSELIPRLSKETINTINPPFSTPVTPRDAANVDTVVLHWTAGGNIDSAVKTLYANNLSYHFFINNDALGTVIQSVPVLNRASHAGESVGPHGFSVNETSIGISFVNIGNSTVPISQAQINSAIKLIYDLHFGLIAKGGVGIKYITTHYNISPGRKIDPYTITDIGSTIVDKVQQLVSTTPTPAQKIVYWQTGMSSTSPLTGCGCASTPQTTTFVDANNNPITWCKRSNGKCKKNGYDYGYETLVDSLSNLSPDTISANIAYSDLSTS